MQSGPRAPAAPEVLQRVPVSEEAPYEAARVAGAPPSRELGGRERVQLGSVAANLFRGILRPGWQLAQLSSEERAALAGTLRDVQAALPALSRDHDGQRLLEGVAILIHVYRAPGSSVAVKVLADVRDNVQESRGAIGAVPRLGDFQNQLVTLARRQCPGLLDDLIAALPELHVKVPALERTAERLAHAHGRALADFNTVVIGHVLGDAPAFFSALERVGLDKTTTHVLAVPYSSNELAIEVLRRRGYDAANPQGADPCGWGEIVDLTTGQEQLAARARLFAAGKEASVADVLGKALRDHERNGRPILVLDDGGYALSVIKERFPERLHLFRFVEQTTRGIRTIERAGCSGRPVIDVARSRVKTEIEGPFIADDLIQAMLRTARELVGVRLAGARIGVIGYGTIGQSVARELGRAGAHVVVYDADPAARDAARAHGMTVADEPKEALAGKQIVLGCTGATSIDPASFLYLDAHTALVSTSSIDVEFRGAGANAQALREVQASAAAALRVDAPVHRAPPNVHISATANVPGSPLHGRTLERGDLLQNKIGRAAVESLERSLAGFGGSVSVKMSVSSEVPRGLARLLDVLSSPVQAGIAAALPPDSGWRDAITETMLVGQSAPRPVRLVNGGYPVNFDRAIQGIAPERIQITRAAMLAGAVQAALRDPASEQGGIVPLDAELQRWVEEDFRALAPAEYAFAARLTPPPRPRAAPR